MGITGFASRIRSHGDIKIIGHAGEPADDHAIIDGPSLAHALLHSSKAFRTEDDGIVPRYDYSKLGHAAVSWLDCLEEHGFIIEAIFFDGALPEHKKDIRIERLQAYANKLVALKTVHDDAAKTMRGSSSRPPNELDRRRVEIAQRALSPPPFLVFAVIDALKGSRYADRVSVVDGEADEFCAALAMSMPLEGNIHRMTIFTNDSDLLVYGLSERVRVVMINEMDFGQDKNGRIITSLEFWPSHLRALNGRDRQPDLIRPAYLMQLDHHLTFRNALVEAQRDRPEFSTSEFESFAATYDLYRAEKQLATLREYGDRIWMLDSRISELLRTAVKERDRIREVRAWYAVKEERLLERMEKDLANGWPDTHPAEGRRSGAREFEVGVDTKDYAYDQEVLALQPADMDLFLPVLFEDPSRATAWKAGTLFREVAVHLATLICGAPATVYEYKRSGHRVRGMACQQISEDVCRERLELWGKNWREDCEGGDVNRWRIVVMEHLLADMAFEEMLLPSKNAVARVLSGAPATTWEALHFNAQFQAENYSLRMLKQVLGFVKRFETDVSNRWAHIDEALEVLGSLPDIGTFFSTDDKPSDFECMRVAERLLREFGIDSEPRVKEVPAKRSSDGKKNEKKKKKKKSDGVKLNAFASLGDLEANEEA